VADSEAHETIERAWKLFQREKRAKHAAALEAKLAAMVDACEELDRVTNGEGGAGRHVFERAMARASFSPPEEIKGKKGSEARFLEVRLEGMWPRESWVPTETRGKGWNYEWKRPGTGGSVSRNFPHIPGSKTQLTRQ
jgi:large subunit ribosomal protein L40